MKITELSKDEVEKYLSGLNDEARKAVQVFAEEKIPEWSEMCHATGRAFGDDLRLAIERGVEPTAAIAILRTHYCEMGKAMVWASETLKVEIKKVEESA